MNFLNKFFYGADYFSVDTTNPVQRTITYRVGGVTGVVVATVVVVYTDAFRQRLLTVTVT